MNTKSRKYYEQRIDSNQGCVKLPTKTIPKGYPKNLTQKDFTVSDKSDFSSIIRNLEKYGVCVVPNFIEKSSCKEALKEIQPKFYRYDSWNGSPFPKETTVVTRSVLHSSTILEKIVSDPLFGGVAEKFLNERNYFMAGKVLKEYTCGIQLNSGIVYKVGPGAADQGYHREDYVHHTVHQSRNTFKHGEETMLGLGVAFTDMSKENGATRFIVGSHLWGPYDACGSFDKEMEFYIEAKEGDAVLFLGSVYHAASANHTSKDRIAGFFL
ncbi:LAFE_0F00320g1_1 [Lachancea fermentati]|uniref:LAFE_0F00320g1_1 n=1 Tax=Lachancea fermentati TaxID=4955 RepID=A0A1G4MDZ2_LACFM|nr:LAFE_0F00320g1_1 [Lachancea fermentati]